MSEQWKIIIGNLTTEKRRLQDDQDFGGWFPGVPSPDDNVPTLGDTSTDKWLSDDMPDTSKPS